MTPIGFDASTGALIITGNNVYPAGSLVAFVSSTWPDRIQINSLAGRGEQAVLWSDVTSLDGSFVPTGIDDSLAYLQGEFAKQRAVGELFGVATTAGTDLVRGTPVAVSRATGQLLPARADTYPLSFIVGLASADTAKGFTNQPAHGAVTLDDWTGIAGAASLSVGQPYFLNASGGLSLAPDRSAVVCIAQVGVATALHTLIVQPRDPILL